MTAERSIRSRPKTTTALPAFRPVQLATLVDAVPGGNRWLHEMKYDGYRLEVVVGGSRARAFTRSGLDWSEKFSGIVDAAASLKVDSAVLDGEAVVFDAEGRSSFQTLQGALKGEPGKIAYVAFDLLALNGEDLSSRPLLERKALLRDLLPKTPGRLRYSDHIRGSGEKLLNSFCANGLEGVVSKLADSRYVGARSAAWVKTKCIQRQEFVVVGWLPSDKSRAFRSLILAVNDNGALRYAGKVGTGFDTMELQRLLEVMKPLEQDNPTVKAPRAEVRDARWLRPRLVAEIAFTEMTNEGTLRHPSYLGLRDDKKPEAVVVEKPALETPAPGGEIVPISNAHVGLPPSVTVRIIRAGLPILLSQVELGLGLAIIAPSALAHARLPAGLTHRPLSAKDGLSVSFAAAWYHQNDNPALRRFVSSARAAR
ncbi:non-homologous end-joining DNA ligase [Brevundimonas pondensis]|uniref:DNA ligase (ATP) n=1 Tax=Brevundimonas pondensis TaxID=2774189 RepID=A0ABX7SHC6_9CAUL|nr:non-homologous end-joining DNA ligase [Brevundimonas pondensis]QTC87041.1 non-homologous end-joining DNA ligase [Brevundimonas pondensis]